jgi:transposase-like protein
MRLSQLGQYAEALPFFKRAADMDGTASSCHWLGIAYCKLGQYNDALVWLLRAEEKGIKSIKMLQQANDAWMGKALCGLQLYAQATPYLWRTVKSAAAAFTRTYQFSISEDISSLERFLEYFRLYRQCLEKLERLVQPSKKENKNWEKASIKGTMRRYVQFLVEHSEGIQAHAAVMKIGDLVAEQERSRTFLLTKVLPVGAAGDVRFEPTGFLGQGYELHIITHLLPHHSAAETDPRVKGAYGSKEALERYVKERMGEIYRAVFTSSEVKLTNVTIECRHGVHHTIHRTFGKDEFNHATAIYTTSISAKEATKHDWTSISSEEITRRWIKKYNGIPSLTFK